MLSPLCPYCRQLERELTCLPAATLRKVGPAPHPGSTVELTLLTGMHASWPRECEHGRSGPDSHLLYGDVNGVGDVGGEIFSLSYPSPPVAGGIAGPEVKRTSQLGQHLKGCSIQESRPCW